MTLFERISWYDLVGGSVCHWGVSFEVSKSPVQVSLLVLPGDPEVELTAPFPAFCLPPGSHAPSYNGLNP